jgi:exonuclease III
MLPSHGLRECWLGDTLSRKMANLGDITLCSYNCRGIKNAFHAINNMCSQHDIIFIQEHWLLPCDLALLNTIHSDFVSVGLSAVDISSNILVGRPYGGTAILYRKNLADRIKSIVTDESRITGIQLETSFGPTLLLNVYMPTNYGDDLSLESYIDCLCKLHALILESDAIHTLIAGDFNCSPGSRFFPEFSSFAIENNLITSDLHRLHDIVTYISDDGSKQSWVDHILSSTVIDNLLANICILNDVIASDHKPMSFTICGVSDSTNIEMAVKNKDTTYRVPLWNNCDDTTLAFYSTYLDNLLQDVVVQFNVLFNSIHDKTCHPVIDKFYAAIIQCLTKATNDSILLRNCKANNNFNIPGWNTYVSEKHDAARTAFLAWINAN